MHVIRLQFLIEKRGYGVIQNYNGVLIVSVLFPLGNV